MVHIPRIISAPRDPGAIVGKAFALVLPGVIGGYNQYGLLTVKMDQNESNSVMLRSIYKPNSANMYGLSHSHVAIDYVYIYTLRNTLGSSIRLQEIA